MPKFVFVSLITLVFSSVAFALGKDGHEAVCYIAYDQMNPETRAKVDALIRIDPEYSQYEDPGEAFANSCNWADEIKPTRWQDHFVNLPRETELISSLDCPLAKSCVLSAILSDINILRDETVSDTLKLEAIKFTGHWIGDLHTPLHVSFEDDRGGNNIKVESPGGCKDLHSVWDRCLVRHYMSTHGLETSAYLAARIRLTIPEKERHRYTGQKSILSSARDAYRVTTSSIALYCHDKGHRCVPMSEIMGKTPKSLEGYTPRLTDAYMDRNSEALMALVRQAGTVLATLLEKELKVKDGTPI